MLKRTLIDNHYKLFVDQSEATLPLGCDNLHWNNQIWMQYHTALSVGVCIDTDLSEFEAIHITAFFKQQVTQCSNEENSKTQKPNFILKRVE